VFLCIEDNVEYTSSPSPSPPPPPQRSLSYDRSIASSKASSLQTAI